VQVGLFPGCSSCHLSAEVFPLLNFLVVEGRCEVFGLPDLADLYVGFAVGGLGHRLTHSMASSRDLTCRNQKPAMTSLLSAKGPSMTVRFLPEKWTRPLSRKGEDRRSLTRLRLLRARR
jgi:hypothetical protein